MSWDITLCVPGTEHNHDDYDTQTWSSPVPVTVDTHEEGGTYVLGGIPEARLYVTYNYARFFPFRDLDLKTAGETVTLIRSACAELGTARDSSYWAATPGNAGYALSILLGWAEAHPEGIWRVE